MTEDADRLAEISARWNTQWGHRQVVEDVSWLIAYVREQQNDLEVCPAEHVRLTGRVKELEEALRLANSKNYLGQLEAEEREHIRIEKHQESENAALRAENEKLRAALEIVASSRTSFAQGAREALEGKQ